MYSKCIKTCMTVVYFNNQFSIWSKETNIKGQNLQIALKANFHYFVQQIYTSWLSVTTKLSYLLLGGLSSNELFYLLVCRRFWQVAVFLCSVNFLWCGYLCQSFVSHFVGCFFLNIIRYVWQPNNDLFSGKHFFLWSGDFFPRQSVLSLTSQKSWNTI